jgi:hypothetical protein
MAKLKIQKTANGITVDSFVSNIQINGSRIGGTGGDENQTVSTIRIRYLRDTGGAVDTGYITAQKGTQKFQVNNTSEANTTVVSLVNRTSTELTAANTATILANVMTISGGNVANIGTGGGGYTNNRSYAYVTWATANVAGNAYPGIGHQITAGAGGLGTGFPSGNVTVVAINSQTNVTVSVADQTITTNAAGRMSLTESFNVKRITNKYVWEWDNSKWRYYLGNPYSAGTTPLASQPEWQSVVLVRVDNA